MADNNFRQHRPMMNENLDFNPQYRNDHLFMIDRDYLETGQTELQLKHLSKNLQVTFLTLLFDVFFVLVMLNNEPKSIKLSAQYLAEKYWAQSWVMLQCISKILRIVVGIQSYRYPMLLLDFDYQRTFYRIHLWIVLGSVALFANCLLLPLYEGILLWKGAPKELEFD